MKEIIITSKKLTCVVIKCTSYDTAKGIPCPLIKPVVEFVEALVCQVTGCPVVEVRVKLVDDAFESEHGKQPGGEG